MPFAEFFLPFVECFCRSTDSHAKMPRKQTNFMVQALHLELKRSRETKFIHAHGCGFVVRIQRGGILHRKHFSARIHGGEALAYKAAGCWRDEQLAQVGPPLARPYCLNKNKRNKTGKVGVGFVKNQRGQVTGVIARWREDCGKFVSKSFCVKKMGFETALSAAKTLRELKELELQCYHQMDHLLISRNNRRFDALF